VALKLTSVSDSLAVFENEDEGYPQTITYRHTAEDSMTVTLEGENEGTSMTTKLSYARD
jgi:hypothetical protein